MVGENMIPIDIMLRLTTTTTTRIVIKDSYCIVCIKILYG